MALRVASAFRTVSRDAAHVISGLLPIEILARSRGGYISTEAKGCQMQMTVGKEKDRKVFNAGRHSGTAPKRADGPTTTLLLPDADANWPWMLPKIFIQV